MTSQLLAEAEEQMHQQEEEDEGEQMYAPLLVAKLQVWYPPLC